MREKKAVTEPSAGIYYMVPDPVSKKYEVHTVLEEPGEDPLHIFMWDHISKLLASKFKINHAMISDTYTGIPRGRIVAPAERTGVWIIAHGNDVDLGMYGHEILAEFGLRDLAALNKVRWEHDAHENMSVREKSQVESTCKFRLTKTGIIPA
jgi:hypothetical protein